MNKYILIFLLILVSGGHVFAQAGGDAGNGAKTKDFINLLAKKDFDAAENYFGDDFKTKLSKEKLAETWDSIISQFGALKEPGESKTQKNGDLEVVFTPVQFEKANLTFIVSFDRNGKIGGFAIKPTGQGELNTEPYKAPEYVNPATFSEREMTIGEGGEWALPATLTLPAGPGPFPALILVHGSGANDRDETSLNPANKAFKDLAWGLASRGIAVLRYEKRTRQYGSKMAAGRHFTINDETVDDALTAAGLLRKTKEIDGRKIFVLGHSLGGMMIPRIGEKDKDLAGLIVFAGLTRRIEDTFLDQITYISQLDGTVSKEEQAQIDALKPLIAKIKTLKTSDSNSPEFYFGAPAPYWLDLRNYSPTLEAAKLEKPILILQGERDYQVTMTDFQNWKDALKGHSNAAFKSYPGLNHLFMAGEGTPSPEDYMKTNHVSAAVVSDIADWIGGQGKIK